MVSKGLKNQLLQLPLICISHVYSWVFETQLRVTAAYEATRHSHSPLVHTLPLQ